ncbi:hypothetical protein XI25_10470 [Paenibacillus sp. DMB20]|nr:hypothetical protein XI25_10470 [Paenibacillus sp. DMB20]
MLHESVKHQILAAGGLLCDFWRDADLVLCNNAAGGPMLESARQHESGSPGVGAVCGTLFGCGTVPDSNQRLLYALEPHV